MMTNPGFHIEYRINGTSEIGFGHSPRCYLRLRRFRLGKTPLRLSLFAFAATRRRYPEQLCVC
jgi:hypothetical protein